MAMRGLRFLLIVVLAAVMDLGSPVLPEVGEAFEELEEAAHGRRRLTPPRHAGSPAAPTTVIPAVAAQRPVPRRSPARTTHTPARKVPPPLPDPASASEDH